MAREDIFKTLSRTMKMDFDGGIRKRCDRMRLGLNGLETGDAGITTRAVFRELAH